MFKLFSFKYQCLIISFFHATLTAQNEILTPKLSESTESVFIKNLDTNSLTINDLVIFESDIQFMAKLLKEESGDLKKLTKEFRGQAIERLTEEALYIDELRKNIQNDHQESINHGQNSRFYQNEQQEREFQDAIFSSKNLNYITTYLIKRQFTSSQENMDESEQFQNFIKNIQQEAAAKDHPIDLYTWATLRKEIIRLSKGQKAHEYQKSLILLPSQIEKEVADIVKQLLTSAEFEVQIFKQKLPEKCSLETLEHMRNALKEALGTVNNSLEDFEDFITAYSGASDRSFHLNHMFKMNWNQLSPLLQREIKSFEGGQFFGPFREGNELRIYRINRINVPYCTQKVKKYSVLKIFHRADALENNAVVRHKMNRWANDIENEQQSFEEIAKKNSQDLISAERGGLVESAFLEDISLDPKVQHAIVETLSLSHPLSSPIQGADGWYLISLKNIEEEFIDAREMSSLKTRAREQLIARGQEEFLEKHLAELRKYSTIHHFNGEFCESMNF